MIKETATILLVLFVIILVGLVLSGEITNEEHKDKDSVAFVCELDVANSVGRNYEVEPDSAFEKLDHNSENLEFKESSIENKSVAENVALDMEKNYSGPYTTEEGILSNFTVNEQTIKWHRDINPLTYTFTGLVPYEGKNFRRYKVNDEDFILLSPDYKIMIMYYVFTFDNKKSNNIAYYKQGDRRKNNSSTGQPLNLYPSTGLQQPATQQGTSGMMTRMRVCTVCHGTGLCPICNGSSRVTNPYTNSRSLDVCGGCNGQKYCSSCGGTGRKEQIIRY